MTAGTREMLPEFSVLVTDREVLAEFTKVMLEWGHYRTAKGLRYPTLAEARQVAAGRRDGRGWNTTPLP